MTVSYVEYELQNGYIDNWLTAGPQTLFVESPEQFTGVDYRSQILNSFAIKKSGITKMPVERGPLSDGVFKIGNYQGSWSYIRCGEDHFIDHSTTSATISFLRSWAYSQIVCPASRPVQMILSTCGPAEVWVNHKQVFSKIDFTENAVDAAFGVNLQDGMNEVLVRFEGVADPEAQLVMALKVQGENDLKVRIPTLIRSLSRRNELEGIYEKIYLDRDVYAAEDLVYLHWPEDMPKPGYNDVHFKETGGMIQGQAEDVGKPGDKLFLGAAGSLKEGDFTAIVMPRAWELYESQIRITREYPAILMGRYGFSEIPYGSPEERSREALVNGAQRENDLFAEIAKMALGWWQNLEPQILVKAAADVRQHRNGSPMILLGLLGMVMRYGDQVEFPQWVKKPIQESILNYLYWMDEPGVESLQDSAEGQQILLHTCELLAGQLYPSRVFKRSGQTGKTHRQESEQRALTWMEERGKSGFYDWDSHASFAEILVALSHLIDLARSEAVLELASVLMDKMFYELALNSYKGVFGSSQGNARSRAIKSGLLEATSGITRLLWGMGVFNDQISGAVSLAQMKNYILPPILAEIAIGTGNELWNREQQAVSDRVVNKVTYRTPDGMLSSVQDYHPGMPGSREHIWQATLGPASVVFVNHPGTSSEKEERGPNYWRGNGTLPRVAQWKDVLIAFYNLPADARLQYTHAYFPKINFDETVFRDGWAFARKGDGYLALTASPNFKEISQGRTARRELRVDGSQAVWLCHLGNLTQDGDFQTFQQKIGALKITFSGLQVDCQTLRGDRLGFGWEGALTRNGMEVSLSGFTHFDNPYTQAELPCEKMEIKTDNYLLRLDFSGTLL